MKKLFFCMAVLTAKTVAAQELFVYTEPASNMAAKSIAPRLTNYFMNDIHSSKINYHLMPEVMIGVSKNLMVHASAFISNKESSGFEAEGGQVYAKYRFLSQDDIHNHFRMAAFGRYTFNNSPIHQPGIDFNGHSSGYEAGVIATKLITKVAVSAGSSYIHATDNGNEKFLYGDKNRNAIGYTLALGKLMLPKEYTNYKQTNVNLMVEMLGQTALGNGYSFLDVAPSVQFIFNSRARIDAAYRFNIVNQLHRTAPEGFLLRFEYNFFNVLK